MSYFLNGNFKDNEFELITRDKYFRDETQIIERRYQRSVCVTRSHKFEKMINTIMLVCFYSKNADFKKLSDKFEISKSLSYLEYLNKHNMIYITFNCNASDSKIYLNYIEFYQTRLIRCIIEAYPTVNGLYI